jgi:hypothetical protein
VTREESKHQIIDHWLSWKAGVTRGGRPDMKPFLRFIATERAYLLPAVGLPELREARDWLLEYERSRG